MATKQQVLRRFLPQYLRGSKKEKGRILSIVCETTNMHRKAVIRALRRLRRKDPWKQKVRKSRGRPCCYLPDVTAALKRLWDISGEPCGELLHPMIGEYVEALRKEKAWDFGESATQKLLEISEGSVKKRVGDFKRSKGSIRGKSTTRPSELKEIIPIFNGPWKDKAPGYGQIDTVAHCGSTLLGEFVYTLQYVDTASYWVVPIAQTGKGQHVTQASLSSIREKLPFTLVGVHSDTGSEFINWHLKRWCEQEEIEQTRSRPYHKNDNAYIEERNGHVVRKHLGYTRFDAKDIEKLVNAFYESLVMYHNHFIASRRCIEKVRIGSTYKKKFERAMTPYRKLLLDDRVSEEVKQRLKEEHEKLNLLQLRKELDTLYKQIHFFQKSCGNTQDNTVTLI